MHTRMAKNLISAKNLLPVLNATSLSFSRLFETKRKQGALSESEARVYSNIEECLREGVRRAKNEASVYSIYAAFSKGCLLKAYTEEAAILGLLAYECALTFKGKETLAGRDWGEGFAHAYEIAKTLYDGPILFEDASIVAEAYARRIEDLDGLIALFRGPHEPMKGAEVFYDFLKAQAMGFASPLTLKEDGPFDDLSKARLELDGYHLTFTLQFLNAKHKEFDEEGYLACLHANGSNVFYETKGTQIHVDMETFTPAPILEKSQEYGEFVTLQLKNRYVETLDKTPLYFRNKRPSIGDRAVVSVVLSKKCADLFLDLGAEVVYEEEAGRTSIEELLRLFKKSSSTNVIFLPISKRLYLLGKIASRLLEEKNVIVLRSSSLQQAYFALSDALFEEEGIDALLDSLNAGLTNIIPLEAKKGRLLNVLSAYEGIEDAEFCFVMYGGNDMKEITDAKMALEDINPYLEVGELDLGLDEETYLLGVSK